MPSASASLRRLGAMAFGLALAMSVAAQGGPAAGAAAGTAPPLPTVVGKSVGAAQRILAGRAPDAALELARTVVSGKRPGTVLAQDPRAGARGATLRVTVAAPPAKACTPAQLAVRFVAGGTGARRAFGDLDLSDSSTHWCTVSGPVNVVGLGVAGANATTAVTFALTTQVLSPPLVTAGAATAAPSAGRPAVLPGITVQLPVDGSPCPVIPMPPKPTPGGTVYPATWSVTLPAQGTLLAPNGTTSGQPTPTTHEPPGALGTCQGQLRPGGKGRGATRAEVAL